jgi:hypothetical protein
MTTFYLVNLIGWFILLLAYFVKYLMVRKENKLTKALEVRISKMNESTNEELVQLKSEIQDLQLRRFGAFGSYGVHAQILTFGLGVFVVNFLYLIL